MKKVLKSVAMILVIVVLANTVTSCIVLAPKFGFSYGEVGKKLDLIVLGICIVAAVVYLATGINIADFTSLPTPDGGISIASANQTHIFLGDGIAQSSFMETFNALPKAQIDTLTQKVQAIPEEEMLYFMETFSFTHQTDNISYIKELNALSETELLNSVVYLNSLSETQFINLLRDTVPKR